jgi:2-oxoglutarate decarboxylase
VVATTAAQYFHLLRRQMHRSVRKPLVVFTPKSPLRMKESHSPIEALMNGSFEEVLDDPFVKDREAVRRLVFCTGKVAWDAFGRRDEKSAAAAIIRVEQLFPFPQQQLLDVLERYPNAKDLVWLQEEPANMGAWHFVFHRTHPIEQRGYQVSCVSRVESGSPATGSHKIHDQELDELMEETFSGV